MPQSGKRIEVPPLLDRTRMGYPQTGQVQGYTIEQDLVTVPPPSFPAQDQDRGTYSTSLRTTHAMSSMSHAVTQEDFLVFQLDLVSLSK